MKKLLKWIGGFFFVFIILVSVGIYVSSQKRLNRVYEIPDETVQGKTVRRRGEKRIHSRLLQYRALHRGVPGIRPGSHAGNFG